MSVKVYIDSEQLELSPNTTIAVTKQINNIADLSTVQGDRSNRIKVPLTDNNKANLGNPHMINGTTDKSYERLSDCRIYSRSGIPILTGGLGRILKVEGNYVDLAIASGVIPIFKELEGKTIHDLDFSADDYILSIPNVVTRLSATSGVVYCCVDYGASDPTNDIFHILYQGPGYYLYSLIEKIFDEIGYTIEGDILSNTFYLDLVCQFGNRDWKHSNRYIEQTSFSNSQTIPENYSGFSSSSTTNKLDYTPSWSIYTASTAVGFNVGITGVVNTYTPLLNPGDSVTTRINIEDSNGVIYASQTVSFSGQTIQIPPVLVSLNAGESVFITFRGDYTITGFVSSGYVVNFTTLEIYSPPGDETIEEGHSITPESFLPNWNQIDLVKGWMGLFSLVPVINEHEKIVTFRYFDDLRDNIPNALDWSSKLMRKKGNPNWYSSKSTSIGNYAQNNYLKWGRDETIIAENVGRGNMPITDGNLEESNVAIQLPWSASEMTTTLSTSQRMVRIPRLELIDGEYISTRSPQHRLVWIKREDFNLDVVANTDPNTISVSTDVPLAKFIEPGEVENLGFDNNLQSRYYSTLTNVLERPLVLTVLLNLTASDINKIDHFTPVWFDKFNKYFYVNKVSNYIEGQPTEVEIISLGNG